MRPLIPIIAICISLAIYLATCIALYSGSRSYFNPYTFETKNDCYFILYPTNAKILYWSSAKTSHFAEILNIYEITPEPGYRWLLIRDNNDFKTVYTKTSQILLTIELSELTSAEYREVIDQLRR